MKFGSRSLRWRRTLKDCDCCCYSGPALEATRADSDWDFCFKLVIPSSYADAFQRLAEAAVIDQDLASRLIRAAGFGNIVAHAYEQLDMVRVHRAAREGPADLRAFPAALRDRLPEQQDSKA